MIKVWFTALTVTASIQIAYTQVSINTDNSSPHLSAMLDIKSTEKGVLVPRMTSGERGLIDSPASGLLVYDMTSESFWFYTGTTWEELISGYVSTLRDADNDTKVQVEESPDEDIIRFDLAGSERMVLQSNANGVVRLDIKDVGLNTFIGENSGQNMGGGTTENTMIGANSGGIAMSGNFNTAVGSSSLTSVTGSDNTAFGAWALRYTTSGSNNTGIGSGALATNNQGNDNVAIGEGSLNANTQGNANIGIGRKAMTNNITGSRNVAIGNAAMYQTQSDLISNVAVGDSAMAFAQKDNGVANPFSVAVGANALKKTQGFWNNAVGYNALSENTTGDGNTAFGYEALKSNIGGGQNVALGASALKMNGSGQSNVAVGSNALTNATNNYNVAVGNFALSALTSGNRNVAIGNGAMYQTQNDLIGNVAVGDSAMAFAQKDNGVSNPFSVAVGVNALKKTQGFWNNAVGYNALSENTTGDGNTALGYEALKSNISGGQNVALGASALKMNESGYSNTAMGVDALRGNVGGFENTAVGREALKVNLGGNSNTAVGIWSLLDNVSGNSNTAVGRDAVGNNISGHNNTGVGRDALLANTSGGERTALGYSANSTGTNYTNSTGIGYNADCTASNQIFIGNGAVTDIGGVVNWTILSDRQFKTQVTENVPGIAFIQRLRPVTYHFDLRAYDDFFAEHYNERDPSLQTNREKEQIQYSGFIAQEVESAAQAIGYNFSGVDAPKNENDFYGLRYAEFVVPLVKAVQELSSLNSQLQQQLLSLQAEVETLKSRTN
ncbi:MAG TPA: tail fiber domain-containing protein [Saprospiraceae bacterium]|nr:tail fiber domain-containing protein [Saprospiraceae bacterium]